MEQKKVTTKPKTEALNKALVSSSKPAVLEIKCCNKCPFWDEKRMYTSDSFEMAFDWFCKKKNNKKIAGYVEWNDKVEVPDWCPLRG